MSLIVETGTGSATSESYISVADADIYHAARGNAAWAALSTTEKEQALRKATAYMLGTYRARWSGMRFGTTQALDWPRSLVPLRDVPFSTYVADNVVPAEVSTACASLAVRAAAGALLADQTRRKSSVTVGPISTTYEAGGKVSVTYAEIDAMLRPYLTTGAGQVRLVRV